MCPEESGLTERVSHVVVVVVVVFVFLLANWQKHVCCFFFNKMTGLQLLLSMRSQARCLCGCFTVQFLCRGAGVNTPTVKVK